MRIRQFRRHKRADDIRSAWNDNVKTVKGDFSFSRLRGPMKGVASTSLLCFPSFLREGRRESEAMGGEQSLLGLQSRLAGAQPMHEESQAGARLRSRSRTETRSRQNNKCRDGRTYHVLLGWIAAELHG